MPSKSYIFIAPTSPIYNRDIVPVFEKLNQEDSSLLYNSLYMNHFDILSRLNLYETVYFFDERDKDFLPECFLNDNITTHFVRTSNIWHGIKRIIAEKIHQESPNILVLFSNLIGITPADIVKYFNLLNHEDYNILAGRSGSEKIGLIGLNYFETRLFEDFSSCDISYNSFLQHTGKLNSFLITVNGIMTIENFEHFRTLYKVLSKKESLEFCSHKIHEMFTHLFIEYKEFL